MTTVAHAPTQVHHEPMSFWRKYIFSTDHKIIGIQFLFVSLFFLLLGGLMAMQIRWQLGFPGKPLPGGGILPESMTSGGVILPEYYIQLVTMHGTFMVFFAIMPLLMGVYANFLIPLKIGTHDMAFPRLNMWSFWLAFTAGLIMVAGFFVPDGAARAGWTMYAPLSARPDLSGATYGQMLWCVSIVVLGLSSVLGSVNYITTVINHRAPGMSWFRLPLSVWAIFITAILAVLALPVLQGAAIMLLFDQTIGTHFFDPLAGGQALLWQHLFWFFGHPEVYILILPAMGMVSDIIANGSRKPIFGYHSMVFAIVGIAFLGWIVWGHHMFMSGMNPTLGSTFMVSTLLISVPSAIKVFNWLGTMWRGNLHFTVPMLNAVGFVSMFTIGGAVRVVRRDPLLVSKDVRPHDERTDRQAPLLADVRDLQPDLLPDAHPWDGRPHATDLRPDAIRLPEGDAAAQRVHLDRRVRAVRRAAAVSLQLPLEPEAGEKGGAEPLARQRARVVVAESRSARQLGARAQRVPRTLRVQRARGGERGLPAPVREALH